MNMPYDRQVTVRVNYDPDLHAYDPVRHAKEENWAEITKNQWRKHVIECGANNYLLRLVDPTWLRPLKTRPPSSPG